MDEFMKVQEEDPAARGVPPAGKRTGSRLQNMWRWRSWGGEADAAQQGPSSSTPPGPRREHSRTVSAGSDMELTPWTGSTTSGSYRRSSHSDGPAAGSELGQATSPLPRSATPASASRRVSMSSSAPGGGDAEDLNSVHTQAGSMAHSFSSLHSMLQDLEGGSTAGGGGDANSSSASGSGHPQYKPSLLGSPLFTGPSGLARQQQQQQQQQQQPGDTASEPGDPLVPHRSLSTRSKASTTSEGDSSSYIAPSEQSAEGLPQMVGGLRLTEGQVLAATSASAAGGAATSEGVPVGTQVAVHGDSSVAAEIGSQHSISSLLSSMSDWDAASRRSTGAVSTREEAPGGTLPATALGNSSQADLDPLAAHAAALAAAPTAAAAVAPGVGANPGGSSPPRPPAAAAAAAAADPLGGLPVDQAAAAPAATGGSTDSTKGPLQGAVKGMMKWGSGLGQRLQRNSASASSSNSSMSKAAGSQQELSSRQAE